MKIEFKVTVHYDHGQNASSCDPFRITNCKNKKDKIKTNLSKLSYNPCPVAQNTDNTEQHFYVIVEPTSTEYQIAFTTGELLALLP